MDCNALHVAGGRRVKKKERKERTKKVAVAAGCQGCGGIQKGSQCITRAAAGGGREAAMHLLVVRVQSKHLCRQYLTRNFSCEWEGRKRVRRCLRTADGTQIFCFFTCVLHSSTSLKFCRVIHSSSFSLVYTCVVADAMCVLGLELRKG